MPASYIDVAPDIEGAYLPGPVVPVATYQVGLKHFQAVVLADTTGTVVNPTGQASVYTTLMATVGALTYIGKAAPGSATSAAVWQISRMDETTDFALQWADADGNFDNVWDDRASLTYT